MATTKTQRWIIIVILVATIVGTLGSFAAMILASENYKNDQAKAQKAQEKYQKLMKDYQAKTAAQAQELSNKYYPTFSQYTSRVGEFDRDSVKELSSEDLVVGDGEEIKDNTAFAAYYIGWNPKGKVFDQSIKDGKLSAPFAVESGLKSASVITGWKEGIKGMRLGGVRELTIPSDKAYGEKGQGNDIPANTPLKFIVMAVPKPATIDTSELLKAYQEGQGGGNYGQHYQ